MAPAPILITCDCGIQTRGKSGDVITCVGCGLRYDTAEQARLLEGVAAMTQKRFKLLGRMGLGAVGLMALLGLWQFQTVGLVVAAGITAVLWYVVFMRFMRSRLSVKASTYAPTVTANRK